MKSEKERLSILILVFLMLFGCQGEEPEEKIEVPVGENLLENPGFETWTDSIPDGWKVRTVEHLSRHGGVSNRISRSSVEKKKGKYSCHFSASDSTTHWTVLMQNVPVIPGAEIVLFSNARSVNLQKIEKQNSFSSVYIIFRNEKGERVKKDSRRFVDSMTRPCRGNFLWGERRKMVDIPDEASYAEVGIICTMSGDMYFDNVSAAIKKPPPWEKTETAYIEFYSLPGKPLPEEALKKEAELIESYAEKINLEKPERKIEYYYYPTEEDFKRINVERKYYQAVKWKKKEIHTMEQHEDMVMTHLLINDLGRPPIALGKGLVFYLRADEHNWDPHLDTKRNLMNYQVPALYKTIDNQEFLDMEMSVVVPAWTSFCKYLIDQFGLEKFMSFYRQADGIRHLPPLEALFEKVYDRDFRKVDMDWRLFVMRYETEKESSPMP